MKCLNCGIELEEDSKFCINCGTNIESVNCSRRSHTKAYLYVAITISILGFIGGICAGSVYKIQTGYLFKKEEFNGTLMLYCWIATGLFDLFVFAIHSVCYRLDLLIDKK